MIRNQAETALEKLTELTQVLKPLQGVEAKQANDLVQELVVVITDLLNEIINTDEYDSYIDDLQRRIQRTAPWLFNQYIDPEDLRDTADNEND